MKTGTEQSCKIPSGPPLSATVKSFQFDSCLVAFTSVLPFDPSSDPVWRSSYANPHQIEEEIEAQMGLFNKKK